MSLADRLNARLTRGRAAAEALMTDTCVVSATVMAYNPASYQSEPTLTAVYSGPCKLQTRALVVLEREAGETEQAEVRHELHLPMVGSEAVVRGCVATVTASVYDSALVGKSFTVAGPHVGSHKTARRVPVTADVDA